MLEPSQKAYVAHKTQDIEASMSGMAAHYQIFCIENL